MNVFERAGFWRILALRVRALLWAAVALSGFVAAPGASACTIAETGGDLGTVNSFRVKDGVAVTGQGAFSFVCGPTVLSVLAGTPSLRATLQASVSGLTLKNGGNSIPYQIYTTAGLSTPYLGGAIVINLNSTTLLGVLNGGGGGVLPIHIATTPGANLPAGLYSDTLQVTWTYANICEGLVNIGGLCLGVLSNGTVTRTLTVSLTISNDCTITALPIGFGSAPLVGGFPPVAQNVSLICTKGMSYTVGLSNGGFATGGRRRMASGLNRLAYDFFKADNTVWGSVGTARAAGPAPADGVSSQNSPYTARVYTDQATPPAASYSDSVVVDVSF